MQRPLVDSKDTGKEVEAEGPAELRRRLTRSASAHHFWEDDVAEHLHHELPPHLREQCKYTGAPLARLGHKPLLLATVEGLDEEGRPFQWIARRARKRVQQPYEVPTPQPPVTWLGSLSWKHHEKPGWWVAALFALGSILFLITGIARETRAVSDPAAWPPGIGSLAAALGAWPEVVACWLLYLPATVLQVYEATNMDLPCRLKAWEAGGRAAARPASRLLPSGEHLHTVSWWATLLQLVGIMAFTLGATTELVGTQVELAFHTLKWCQLFGFMLGGILFTVASTLACLEETGSWWRGLVPTRRADLHSISWLAVFFAFHGSVGFLVMGTAFFFKTFSWTSFQWLLAYGQILGSSLFLASSVAGLLEQQNPKHL